jgi:hypothetical protein
MTYILRKINLAAYVKKVRIFRIYHDLELLILRPFTVYFPFTLTLIFIIRKKIPEQAVMST